MRQALAATALAFAVLAACGKTTAPDPRYPARPEGCRIKPFEGAPTFPVDDLGVVEVNCTGETRCGRKLADEVCLRGGDVVWGLGETTVGSMTKRGHAAHSSHTDYGPRPKGCDVKVLTEAPRGKTENIGPVTASCGQDVSDDDCTRELEDAVCALGGDIVWGVGSPALREGKKVFSGRAAHTAK